MMTAIMVDPKTNYFRSSGGGLIGLSVNKETITKIIPVFGTKNPDRKNKRRKKNPENKK